MRGSRTAVRLALALALVISGCRKEEDIYEVNPEDL